jgi:hypothetical protein
MVATLIADQFDDIAARMKRHKLEEQAARIAVEAVEGGTNPETTRRWFQDELRRIAERSGLYEACLATSADRLTAKEERFVTRYLELHP